MVHRQGPVGLRHIAGCPQKSGSRGASSASCGPASSHVVRPVRAVRRSTTPTRSIAISSSNLSIPMVVATVQTPAGGSGPSARTARSRRSLRGSRSRSSTAPWRSDRSLHNATACERRSDADRLRVRPQTRFGLRDACRKERLAPGARDRRQGEETVFDELGGANRNDEVVTPDQRSPSELGSTVDAAEARHVARPRWSDMQWEQKLSAESALVVNRCPHCWQGRVVSMSSTRG